MAGRRRLHGSAGYSLTEMIVVLSVVGILAGIVISQIVGATEGARIGVARQKLETLNRAVAAHQQSNIRDNLENQLPADGAHGDELRVLQQLQYRNPTRPTMGSPYMAPNYRPAGSSSDEDFRIRWTGSNFVLVMPGEAGTGLQVAFDGSDIGPDFVHPPGYKWSSR
jgi:prepilin-type N-terminal cleavage/methylation domain-containing protein